MVTSIAAKYDFSTDAQGLAAFIANEVKDHKITLPVYVVDQDGNPADKALWEIEMLTDGSIVHNLIVHFDRP